MAANYEDTYLRIELHTKPPKDLECLSQILVALGVKHTFNYHIMHIYLHGLPDEGFQKFVYQMLVGGPRVFSPKGIAM